VKITRVCGDEAGETRLMEVEINVGFASPIPIAALRIDPAARPHREFHPAPVRGLVAPVVGEFEVVATNGDRKRLRPGEWLLADDVGTKGHSSAGIGPEVQLLHCALPEDWDDWRPA
jgi:hypothetical protein